MTNERLAAIKEFVAENFSKDEPFTVSDGQCCHAGNRGRDCLFKSLV